MEAILGRDEKKRGEVREYLETYTARLLLEHPSQANNTRGNQKMMRMDHNRKRARKIRGPASRHDWQPTQDIHQPDS